jgi:hypothetical protein
LFGVIMLKNWGSDGQETIPEKRQGSLIIFCLLSSAILVSIIIWMIPAFVKLGGNLCLPSFWMRYTREIVKVIYILLVITIPLAIRFEVIPRKGSSNIIYISSLAGSCVGIMAIIAAQIITDMNYLMYVPVVYLEYNGLFLLGLTICFIILILIRKAVLKFLSKNKQTTGVFGTAEFANKIYLKVNDFYNPTHSLFRER